MPITKVTMKEQMGVRDFCYAMVTTNTANEYVTGEVKSGGWLAKIALSVTEEKVIIWRDNVNAKEIWLKYFNDVLLSKGLITENEHRKMRVLITTKCNK